MKCTPVSARQFRAIVKAEAGTYIKELITGDDRRTKPSVSIILRKPCVCKELDVIAIHEVKE
jgi:tRNA pseudouridine synthase 10